MEEDVVLERANSIDAGYVLEAGGLNVLRTLTREEWAVIGKEIGRRHTSIQWALGDWLVYGGREQQFGDRWVGSSYRNAADITGHSGGYLSRLYTLSEVFPRERRIMSLSWSHHNIALQLGDGDVNKAAYFLRLAMERSLSTSELEAEADSLGVGFSGEWQRTGVVAKRSYYQPRNVKCPECQHVFPVRGNKVLGK